MYNYQPSRSTFNCGELYQAFCRIGAWTPGMHDLCVRYASSNISLPADRIRFAGRPIQIFRAPTVKHLMKLHNHFYPRTKEPISGPRRSESSISTMGCTVRDSKLLATLYSSSYLSEFLRCQTARTKTRMQKWLPSRNRNGSLLHSNMLSNFQIVVIQYYMADGRNLRLRCCGLDPGRV